MLLNYVQFKKLILISENSKFRIYARDAMDYRSQPSNENIFILTPVRTFHGTSVLLTPDSYFQDRSVDWL
jgi:hypothetical protein